MGDMNGDLRNDAAIKRSPLVHVVFGRNGDIDPLDLANLAPPTGFNIVAPSFDLAGSGDLDGDGLSDLILNLSSTQGAIAVVFGSESPAETIDLSIPNDSHAVIIGATAMEGFGADVVVMGDHNGDGISDAYIRSAADAHIVFGTSSRWQPGTSDSLMAHAVAITGLPSNHSAQALDFNGDGLTDLLLDGRVVVYGRGWELFSDSFED
ncbi:MAG: hypothetical protein R3F15_10045 [Lysobacterales bacterium]